MICQRKLDFCRTESARPPEKCVLRRSASGGRTGSACAARHTPTLNALVGRSGRLNYTATPDTTRRSCLCRVWYAGVNWTIALNVFRLQIFCGRQSRVVGNPIHATEARSGRDTYKTVLSCLACRCECRLIAKFHYTDPTGPDPTRQSPRTLFVIG